MAGAQNHPYHLVKPSVWPLVGAFSALLMFAGFAFWMHEYGFWSVPDHGLSFGAKPDEEGARLWLGAGLFVGLGLIGILFTMFSWWADVIREAHGGDHTPVVQLHLRYGMILFIASEVMFFVAWFWAFFNASLFPAAVDAVGGTWPPKGMEVLDPFGFPLLNTLILLCSGTTVTWAHHALINGDRNGLIKGLWLTIGLGMLFTSIQAWEYAHAPFAFKDNIYSSTFFMATGFHGFHVIVGTIFLIVCLIRSYKGHFRPEQHFGFEAAAWYWHFVDVVWLFLFICIYVWGGWGASHG
jgi:cytochrome c oxidase subunit 3